MRFEAGYDGFLRFDRAEVGEGEQKLLGSCARARQTVSAAARSHTQLAETCTWVQLQLMPQTRLRAAGCLHAEQPQHTSIFLLLLMVFVMIHK
jgi:hypothetical protein